MVSRLSTHLSVVEALVPASRQRPVRATINVDGFKQLIGHLPVMSHAIIEVIPVVMPPACRRIDQSPC